MASPANGQLTSFLTRKNSLKIRKSIVKKIRWLCLDISEVPIAMTTKFPATVMVTGVVSNEGDVMPLHFFTNGLKINADKYIKVLHNVVKPWMDSLAAGCHYVFSRMTPLPTTPSWPSTGVQPTCQSYGSRRFGNTAAWIVIPWIIMPELHMRGT
jgi:hypothetical protein